MKANKQNETLEVLGFKEVISYATVSLFTEVVEIENSFEDMVEAMNMFASDTQEFIYWCAEQYINPNSLTLEQGIELLQRYEAMLIDEIELNTEETLEESPLPPNLFRVLQGQICMDCVKASLLGDLEDQVIDEGMVH